MAVHFTIWEPGRPVRNAMLVPLTILLSPLIIVVGLAILVVMWPVRKLFQPKPLSAMAMIEELDDILNGDTDCEADYALQVITRCDFNDERLEAQKMRVAAVGLPPWSTEVIDELKAIRNSARTIAAGEVA